MSYEIAPLNYNRNVQYWETLITDAVQKAIKNFCILCITYIFIFIYPGSRLILSLLYI